MLMIRIYFAMFLFSEKLVDRESEANGQRKKKKNLFHRALHFKIETFQ